MTRLSKYKFTSICLASFFWSAIVKTLWESKSVSGGTALALLMGGAVAIGILHALLWRD